MATASKNKASNVTAGKPKITGAMDRCRRLHIRSGGE